MPLTRLTVPPVGLLTAVMVSVLFSGSVSLSAGLTAAPATVASRTRSSLVVYASSTAVGPSFTQVIVTSVWPVSVAVPSETVLSNP